MLALLYLVAMSLVLTALANWVTNDLNNSTRFASARSLQFAANSATELALQNIRYNPLMASGQTLNASPPTPCWGSGSTSALAGANSIDGVGIEVWCSTAWNPSSANTRVVTISTCPNGVSATVCALNPTLEAVVAFDDYPPGVSAPNEGVCAVYCGTGLTVQSWLWTPQAPRASGVSPTSGTVAGGTPITITGTGFVAGASVNFVLESGGTPDPSNVVLAGTNVVVGGSTTITALTPSVSSPATYFVTVTTPAGTSAYGPLFTFS
jgi:hypothetical protein